jgi:hypothetical protein
MSRKVDEHDNEESEGSPDATSVIEPDRTVERDASLLYTKVSEMQVSFQMALKL